MIVTDIHEIAKYINYPGFYFDINDIICFQMGKYLLTIFINSDDSMLDICVDRLSDRGVYEVNVEWESPSTIDELRNMICRFIVKYNQKGYQNV